jgi:hypothetical protein
MGLESVRIANDPNFNARLDMMWELQASARGHIKHINPATSSHGPQIIYCRCRMLLACKTSAKGLQIVIRLNSNSRQLYLSCLITLRQSSGFCGPNVFSNRWLASAFPLLMSNLKW